MTEVPFLELRPAYEELKREIDTAVCSTLESGWYIGGSDVELFERDFAAYVGTTACVGVGNGLDAITLALMAHDVGPGDEVIVPSHTFIATWLAVTRLGAKVVPVEPCESTMNMDPEQLSSAITSGTRAIIPVHLYGAPAPIVELSEIASKYAIPVIEDAAQAHGACLDGRRIGSSGNTCCWSFYPGKNLGAFGDAGAVTTSDRRIAERIRMLANYGSSTKYVHDVAGINSRLDPLQAAVLRVRLRKLDLWNERRRRIASRYRNAFEPKGLKLQNALPHAVSANHLFVVRLEQRDSCAKKLHARGIGTQIHYPIACCDQRAYAVSGLPPTPIAQRIASEVLSLPIGPHLTDDQVSAVIRHVTEICCPSCS